MSVLLDVGHLHASYGSIHALKGVSFEVREKEIVSLIGSNGAGKSTTLRAISGLIESKGTLKFAGQDMQVVPCHKRVALGMAQSPEGRGIFANMTVTENLEMGAFSRSNRTEINEGIENAFRLFPRLKERRTQMAGTLSGGEQQMLAICRALMSKPKLLLLDEPSLGLAPLIVAQIFDIVKELNSQGMTILLVEQNARMALKVSHRAYVLETGKITLQGPGLELLNNDEVQRCYLGV